ncbi:MAG: type VI secretion system protein ImpL [Desulfobacteraceae bacterium Eth-SRB2]|nr:MAG: type VI secretion system protein ImpL [Desulfobacteraceae bacterium Eth-SRB2]
MKQLIIKILKIFLIVTLILFAVLLVFGLVLGIGWPWWVGLFILTGVIGLWLGIVFFKKVWLRRREQQFVSQVIDQDEHYLKSLGDKERKNSKELQDRWKEAMEALRKSHLKKYGNPLYVLPWYMVIGESGSGKTTAIKSARLSSPFAEISRISGISGTRNCDWWFFEQAILIDTAGRYAIPIDEGRDKEEWQRFLSLLIKFRKKEPLNGLVVSIAADKLIDSGPEALETSGKSIRRRIDELMRVLGSKFPVYVLVTKGDLVQGMTQFCNRIPEKNYDQAMGALNHSLSKDIAEFAGRTLHSISERLKDLRLILFHKPESKGAEPDLLLFPNEFEKLRPGLSAFIRGAFQENPYQETPILRGLFFSSGKQEGTPYSHFLKELGLIEQKEVLPGTDKGLFLHDFFSKILPSDRGLFAPTQRTIEWSRLTRNMGLTSWVAICVAVCGLLSFSFVKNLKTLRGVSNEFAKPSILQGEILEDTITMNRFREAVMSVEEQNRSWWIPRLGLTESRDVEVQLKEKYCNQFQNGFLASFDKQMAETMTRFSAATPEETLGKYAAHLVRRINLLRARIIGEGLGWLKSRPQPLYDNVVLGAGQNLIPEVSQKLTDLYLYFLIWRQDKTSMNQEMNNLQTWLKHILTLEGATLNWLIDWVNSDPSFSPVTLADFWGSSLEKGEHVSVPPCFTIQGKDQIDAFIKEIETALFDPLIIAEQKLDFKKWYSQTYFQIWHDFATVFPNAPDHLKGKEEWKEVAAWMGSDQNPYFALYAMMAKELKPFSKVERRPAWVNFVYDFKSVKLQAEAIKKNKIKKTGLLRKVTSRLTPSERAIGTAAEGALNMESRLLAGKAFYGYQSALDEITPVSASSLVAHKIASEIYTEDPATSQSPFYTAQNALRKLKTVLIKPKTDPKTFWKLVTGPIDFFHEFVLRESACYLQSRWEKEVLMEVQDVSDQKNTNQLLMGESGFAKKFIEGPAEPFLSRTLKKGYYAKKVMGKSIDFNKYFLSYLTKGVVASRPTQSDYSVQIRALPTGANQGALLRPHATSLELQCGSETPKLINLNYPKRKTFNWSAQSCGDVIFNIKVGNIILTKKYTGYLAFPKFIKDFNKGQRIFYPSEFPHEKVALKRMGIKYITVKYQFEGHRPVLKLLRSVPERIPQDIAKCWD